jgi:hypothetical protein
MVATASVCSERVPPLAAGKTVSPSEAAIACAMNGFSHSGNGMVSVCPPFVVSRSYE